MRTISIGIDLAKSVFSACTLDDGGRVVQRQDLRRDAFIAWLAQVPAGTSVAMEACSGAHHWARRCVEHGLQPRLMAAQFVKPFRKSQAAKNDRNDAEAIATAARQGNMRFVPVKSIDQQARLSEHRIREGYKTDALAASNRLRGILAEFGVVVAKSDVALRRLLAELGKLPIPASTRIALDELQQHWSALRDHEAACSRRILAQARDDQRCHRLQQIIGVGPLTADALVASVGNAHDFANGRQLAAWLGLTPRQHSSGGRSKLGTISCRGDRYLRTLLIQGARSSLQRAQAVVVARATPEQMWIRDLATRLPFGKVLVAIANKHARQAWAMLARDEDYDPDAWLRHPMVQRPASARRKVTCLQQ
ncbi:MAG: IS110 family transposase [Arenimonas sp.]